MTNGVLALEEEEALARKKKPRPPASTVDIPLPTPSLLTRTHQHHHHALHHTEDARDRAKLLDQQEEELACFIVIIVAYARGRPAHGAASNMSVTKGKTTPTQT